MARGREVCALIAAPLCAACASSDAAVPVTVRDSAGVEIVESQALLRMDDPAHHWSLVLEREIRTAGEDPTADPRIWEPAGAARTPDGALVIADQGPHRLLLVRDDSVIARFAPPGSGPGEIRGPTNGLALAMRPQPDGSIVVVELWGNARIHRFDASGDFLDDAPLPTFVSGWSTGRAHDEITVEVSDSAAEGDLRFRRVARLDLRTATILPLGRLPEAVPGTPEARRGLYPIVFWTAFRPGGIIAFRTDAARFVYHDPDGRLTREIRLPLSPAPMTEAIRARAAAEYPTFASMEHAPLRRLVRKLMTVNDTLFALEHSWMTRGIEDGGTFDDRMVWRLVSTSGHQRGFVIFPESFNPWVSADGRVIGVSRDDLGVATIHEYRLIEPVRRD